MVQKDINVLFKKVDGYGCKPNQGIVDENASELICDAPLSKLDP
jgi:hypothetical protein